MRTDKNLAWADNECSQERTFICEKKEVECAGFFQGKCYTYNEDPKLSWIDAQGECMEQGGGLVEINSKEEQDYIKGTVLAITYSGLISSCFS